MDFIDGFLNKITMYRLVLYYLVALLLAGGALSAFGILPFPLLNLLFSTALILAVSWLANLVFAKAFHAAANVESVYITAFILALIITPAAPTNAAGVGFLVFASAWAMASKYILAVGKKHIFNPAAFAVALSALLIGQSATWWVGGNLALMPFVVAGGLLIVRKLRRFDLVLSFLAIALLTIACTGTSVSLALSHTPIFFFAFVMLTEPLTMPPDRLRRMLYGATVGFLFAPNIHLGSFYLTPELALLIGNLLSYVMSPKGRFMMSLLEKNELGAGTFEYVFAPDRRFAFQPGQYLEWTLPHESSDSRGNRRYFTIASAPAEKTVNLGVKFNEPKSSFKRALSAMRPNDVVSVSNVAGDFTLPAKKDAKMVFIAGGIGVTPFRSMIGHMLATKDPRSVVLFYGNRTAADVAYKDIFDEAAQYLDLKTVYAFSDEQNPPAGTHSGMIDADLILREVPDYKERLFYISGPHGMVESFKRTLADLGVRRSRIKTDYFPGFA